MSGEDFDPGIDATDSGSDLLDVEPPALPRHVAKVIVRYATVVDKRRPKVGDEVIVHYHLCVHRSGEVVCSSNGGDTLAFILEEKTAPELLLCTLATMRRTEIAKFRVAPHGSTDADYQPPATESPLHTALRQRISESVELEIELVDWISTQNLVEDGSVIKRVLLRPDDRRRPAVGQVCLLNYSLQVRTGSSSEEATCIDDVQDLLYETRGIGPSNALLGLPHEKVQLLPEVFEVAVLGMRRGEKAEVLCSAERGLRKDATVTAPWLATDASLLCMLELKEFIETEDVSFQKNQSIVKKSLRSRDAWPRCQDGGRCTMKVCQGQLDNAAENDVANAEFVVGNGEVCDTLEAVALSLRLDEVAEITCEPSACARWTFNGCEVESSNFMVRVTNYVPGPMDGHTTDMDKLRFVEARRAVAAELFKAGRYALAAERYKACFELLGHVDDFGNVRLGAERKRQVYDLKMRCALSRSLCAGRAGHHKVARESAETVLDEEPHNVKALYRRAQALLGLEEPHAAEQDALLVLQLEPGNCEARALLKQIRTQIKKVEKESKTLCEQMCGALGTLPHPLDVD